MSAGANDGAYAGLGTYQSGTGGGGLHSFVHTLRDQFGSHCAELVTQRSATAGSHCAELTPGAATITPAIGTNVTATTSATRRRAKCVIVSLPPWTVSAHLMPYTKRSEGETPCGPAGQERVRLPEDRASPSHAVPMSDASIIRRYLLFGHLTAAIRIASFAPRPPKRDRGANRK